MNPLDFVLLFVSITAAVMSVTLQGWTVNGIGPAILLMAGGMWQFGMQWLRHRTWLQHRDSGLTPGTQHLALSAAIGWFAGTAGAMIWLLVSQMNR